MTIDRSIGKLTLILTVVSLTFASDLWPSCTGKTMIRSAELSCEEKQTILDEHNRLRQLVALGQVSGQPSAANMREMIWDDELATMAQKWTNRCAEIHDDQRHIHLRMNSPDLRIVEQLIISWKYDPLYDTHSTLIMFNDDRCTGRFPVGQNMARTWTRPAGASDDRPNWRQSIYSWFNEVQHYRAGYSETTGHYTQLVWSDTYLVGCGYSFYYNPAQGYTKNYVCNYGPSGNVLGFEPYQSGRPACGNYGMVYSNRYAGLCSGEHYYYLGALCSYG